jgi:hypothetical protein
MPRRRAVALIAVPLAVVAVLAASAPAGAHPASPVAAEMLRTPVPDIQPAAATAPGDPIPPSSPWSLPLAAVVLGVLGCSALAIAGARRHPRRALVLGLGLLLAVFAFESGVHSVHHGLDAKQYNECSIAAASAHLSAVAVDGVLHASVVLIAARRTAEPDLAAPPTRLLEPHQGRAPPLSA